MSYFSYYSRKDVQDALAALARDREVQVWYPYGPGKRPDSVFYPADIFEFAKQGMISFHVSEERWHDPLRLQPGMSKKDLDLLRKGWDLVLDIDGCDFLLAKFVAVLLLRELELHGVTHYSVKFSGNKGFHIGVCFEAFPSSVNSIPLKDWFPDGLRTIAAYLGSRIEDSLRSSILDAYSADELVTMSGKTSDVLFINGVLQPFSLVDVDTVLISSRHLFRACYSFNEKSGFVSIPVTDIMAFERSTAAPEYVVVTSLFLDPTHVIPGEATRLLIEAFDYAKSSRSIVEKETRDVHNYVEPVDVVVSENSYPPCIRLLLAGVPTDGRKRAVFLLIGFLSKTGKTYDEIKDILLNWNTHNYEPLRDGYIISQVNWSQRQSEKRLPPNCDNQAYYKSIGVCQPDSFCSRIKNPVQYATRKHVIQISSKKKNAVNKKKT